VEGKEEKEDSRGARLPNCPESSNIYAIEGWRGQEGRDGSTGPRQRGVEGVNNAWRFLGEQIWCLPIDRRKVRKKGRGQVMGEEKE